VFHPSEKLRNSNESNFTRDDDSVADACAQCITRTQPGHDARSDAVAAAVAGAVLLSVRRCDYPERNLLRLHGLWSDERVFMRFS